VVNEDPTTSEKRCYTTLCILIF